MSAKVPVITPEYVAALRADLLAKFTVAASRIDGHKGVQFGTDLYAAMLAMYILGASHTSGAVGLPADVLYDLVAHMEENQRAAASRN